MGTSNYSDEFKRDAVHQITARGYPVREASRRLGVSTHSLYKWMKLFGDLSQRALRLTTATSTFRPCLRVRPFSFDSSVIGRAVRASPMWTGRICSRPELRGPDPD